MMPLRMAPVRWLTNWCRSIPIASTSSTAAASLDWAQLISRGFKWALEQGYQYIIQMDADFSHPPEYVPQMLALIPDYDVVVGSRYVKGGQLDVRWAWYRRLLSWWANSVWVRLILGTKTRDATAGFKCWQASALQHIDLDHIRSTGYIFTVEMCYLAEKLGFRIKEIPIYFEDRRIGESKMDAHVKIEAALRVIRAAIALPQCKT